MPTLDHRKLDDYVFMGKYVAFVCLFMELTILPQLCSQFFMVYAAVSPRVTRCGNITFDTVLEDAEICKLIQDKTCEPLEYDAQFLSVNVEWHYYCEKSSVVKNSISIQMLGVLSGAIVFGQLSDTFGRRLNIIASLIGMIISCYFTAHSQNLYDFTIARTVVGFFTGGGMSVMSVYMIENIPKDKRIMLNMAINWSPNMPLIAYLAWYSHTWRHLVLVNGLLCFPPLIMAIFVMHKSPRWLITQGRLEEAKEVILKQFKTSGHLYLYDQQFEDVLQREYDKAVEARAVTARYSYYHLFGNKGLAKTTLLLAYSYCATSILNYGILFNMEKLSGSIYWNTVITALLRYAFNIIFLFADMKFQWVGRKFVHTTGLLAVVPSLGLVIFAYATGLNHELKEVIRIAILLAGAMVSQLYVANFVISNELLPTPIRNIGFSFCQMANRLGVIISPLIFQLQHVWLGLPYFALLLISGLDLFAFALYLPETKGKPLVEQMPQRKSRSLITSDAS